MLVLMDRAARSPFHQKKEARRGPLLDSNRMGAPTAMCAGRVLVLFSILFLLLLLTSATEGVEMIMRLGVCVSFWLPIGLAHSSVFVYLEGIVEHVAIGSLHQFVPRSKEHFQSVLCLLLVTTPIEAFDYGFLTRDSADTFPILICLDSRYGQTGSDVL